MKESTHLRLEGIREALEGLSGPELVAEAMRLDLWSGDTEAPMAEMAFAQPRVEASGSPPAEELLLRTLEAQLDEPRESRPPIAETARFSMPLLGLSPDALYNKIMRRRMKTPHTEDTEDANTWTRIRITNDLEIHFRPGAGRRFHKKLGKLLAMARKSFDK